MVDLDRWLACLTLTLALCLTLAPGVSSDKSEFVKGKTGSDARCRMTNVTHTGIQVTDVALIPTIVVTCVRCPRPACDLWRDLCAQQHLTCLAQSLQLCSHFIYKKLISQLDS
ncbi:hypothetical protein J6590_004974 [Homalodisca vitripennis]|nr:hypothetical protein J6590_004974 [Homalodisca vitripennis]